MKSYEVILEGIVIDGKPISVGETVNLNPSAGEAKAGLYFKQLKALQPVKKKSSKQSAKK
ncbi:MAG: hypothetical protein CL429_04075 [Acidimicrobiaceae bacterium]|nr:hypothetical protein [Acidimicrobiaceae bacterium]|tara:strand:+ start:276 stop:455 length:180 start_codon:yes stop_codon:yes gene_type:complete